jgi:dihydrofolate reductase
VSVEVVYYVAASIDGFIATPDGSVEWLSEFEAAEEDYGYAEFLATVDAIAMGRATFEQVLGFGDWPYPEIATWVFSHSAYSEPPPGVRVTTASAAEVVAEIGAAGARRIWLVGGGELAGAFVRAGLVTEHIVSVMPVLLGEGVRLLGREGSVERLHLESSTRIGDVVQNVYRSLPR